MNQPRTVDDVLKMLGDYHQQRGERYRQLADESTDPLADLLLEHLVELESQSVRVIRTERERLAPAHATYLISGPQLSSEALHAADCSCGHDPSFQDALGCALRSDQRLGEILDRLANCSAAGSVVELAERLQAFETTKDREIAKYVRQD
ncbi:hypothetical protein [Roseimaritima sediminicola]|uniref:hypothetical protein n=1 Tax=Roseimaritima sediminicola TaxID=2662066 RepID=UPI001298264C|nr:hypothetical protein [Roseimaritima sediminicola]